MQKTDLANYSSFLVWKWVSPVYSYIAMDVITLRQSTSIFLFIWPFS